MCSRLPLGDSVRAAIEPALWVRLAAESLPANDVDRRSEPPQSNTLTLAR